MMTIHNRNGTMKIYRSEALQIQLPPDNSIEALRTNVKAKKKAAQIPITIDFTELTSTPFAVIIVGQDLASYLPQDGLLFHALEFYMLK